MRIDTFLIIYATLAFSSVIVLSLIGVETFDVYAALFVILFFVASELSPFSMPGRSHRQVLLAGVLLMVFAVIVLERLIEILT
jgi:hypothetical protein